MMPFVLFAGTMEGRVLAERMEQNQIPCLVCVATEYGEQLLPAGRYVKIYQGRKNSVEMEAFFRQVQPRAVIDATHPYAVEASRNILLACKNTGSRRLRLIRRMDDGRVQEDGVTYFQDVGEAAAFLEGREGNIFLTTGSKELERFSRELTDLSRLYVRILPSVENLLLCQKAGLKGSQILCMQGPFSKELNRAMLGHCKASWLVTKESGEAGGFQEKLQAARELGIFCAVIARPCAEEGYSLEELWDMIQSLRI